MPGESSGGEKQEFLRNRSGFVRNLVAFWFFGLTNNYGYVIMLSAATDILKTQEGNQTDSNTTDSNSTAPGRDCEQLSTGAVLLADIVPTLVIKYTAPFFMEMIPFGIRILLVVLGNLASYLIVAYSQSVAMSLIGVCFASAASGLGEITFLAMSAFYTKSVISTWSSGTGGAGVMGSLVYAAMRQAGLSPKNTLLIQLVVPFVMAVSYWLVLDIPRAVYRIELFHPSTWIITAKARNRMKVAPDKESEDAGKYDSSAPLLASEEDSGDSDLNSSTFQRNSHESNSAPVLRSEKLTLGQKLKLLKPLLRYMIPLGLVYVGEYFINQGLQELIHFNHIWLDRKDQYRWYQVIYQVGVFISRSSVNLIHIRGFLFYLIPVIQFANAAVFFTEAYYWYMPSIWIVFALIFLEGLLGGAAYVNTFFRIKEEVKPEHVEYSLGVASIADSTGVVFAGICSIPIHNWICDQPLPASARI